jgi:hypothetical protein
MFMSRFGGITELKIELRRASQAGGVFFVWSWRLYSEMGVLFRSRAWGVRMKRIKLDEAGPAIQKFFRSLSIDSAGIELELNGRPICKVIPPLQFTDSEKNALVEVRWQLIRRARERNKRAPAKVIAREISDAVDAVRRKKK